MTAKARKVPFFEICSVLISLGIITAYHNFIFSRISIIFFSLFKKDLFARSLLYQRAALFVIFLSIILLLILLDRFILRKINNEHLYNCLLILMFSIPSIQTLIICANQILRRDDYWEIADANSYGFPGSLIFEITNHNGRYLSWGIKSLYAVLPPIPFINILLFLNIGLLTAGFYLLSNEFLSAQNWNSISAREIRFRSFLYSGAIVFGIIPLSSNVWEVWFWGSGTWVYGISISLCVVSFALILRITNCVSSGILIRILAAVACFFACGGSELCTLSLAAFLFYLLCWKRITTKKWNRYVLFYMIEIGICCLGILFMSGSITAAGEFASADSENSVSIFSRLPEMLKSIIQSLWRYTTVNIWILFLLLFVFFMFGTHCQFGQMIRRKIAVISLLLVFTANFILLLNEYIDYAPSRVVTVPLCWIFSALAMLSFSAGSIISERIPVHQSHRLMLLCCLLTVINYGIFYSENIDLIRLIRQSWMIRDESLQDYFDRDETIITCSLPTLGSSHNDLEKDPNELYNIAMRMYLHVPAVTAEKPCSPFDQEP